MNDRDRVRYEACKRCTQFYLDYKKGIASGSKLELKFLELADIITEIETLMSQQSGSAGTASSEFQQKGISREDLVDIMTRAANAARTAEPENPGYQAKFRFDRNLNDADLLARANAFLAATPAEQAVLIEWGAPATWMTTLADAVAEFQAEFGDAVSAVDARVAATAQIPAKVAEAMKVKRTIGWMVPNNFYGDIGAQAAWHSASTVEKINTPPKPDPTPDPGP